MRTLRHLALGTLGLAACVAACTDLRDDAGSSEGNVSTAPSTSVVAVVGRDRVCAGAVLPRGVILVSRSCIEPSRCAKLDPADVRVVPPNAPTTEVRAKDILAPGSSERCSAFAAVRLETPLPEALVSPLKISRRVVALGIALDVARIEALAPDAGRADAAADDADANDAGADDGALEDVATDASDDVVRPDAALEDAEVAFLHPTPHLLRARAIVASSEGDEGAGRRWRVDLPNFRHAIALDHGLALGLSDQDGRFSDLITMDGFAEVLALYASPSEVLEAEGAPGDATPPLEEAPPSAEPAGGARGSTTGERVPTRRDAVSEANCSSSPGGGGASALLLVSIAAVLTGLRRRTRTR